MALVALLVLSLTSPMYADDINDLKKQIEEQNKTLREMQHKLEMLEARQTRQDKDINEAVAKAIDDKKIDVLPDSLKWAENIKINGDLRYRYEMIDEEGSDNRNRNRIRARLGVAGKVNDDIEVKMRLATSDSPVIKVILFQRIKRLMTPSRKSPYGWISPTSSGTQRIAI